MSRQTSLTRLASFAVAAIVLARPAAAADLLLKAQPAPPAPAPSMFDIAFGAGIATDYNFRGISQSDRGLSPFAYFEPRLKVTPNIELYAGIGMLGTKLPTDPPLARSTFTLASARRSGR